MNKCSEMLLLFCICVTSHHTAYHILFCVLSADDIILVRRRLPLPSVPSQKVPVEIHVFDVFFVNIEFFFTDVAFVFVGLNICHRY